MTDRSRILVVLGAVGLILVAVWASTKLEQRTAPHLKAVYTSHESRSTHWPALRKQHLEREPACVFCGSKNDLQVHHIQPYHTHPELELEPSNLITLCGPKGNNCHFLFGHLGGYERWNPDVRADAARYRREVQEAKTRANGLK